MAMSPAERKARSQKAINTRWAKTIDRTAATQPGRDAFNKKFLDQVDPNRELPEAQRLKMAAAARRAFYADLSLKSAKARRLKNTKQAS